MVVVPLLDALPLGVHMKQLVSDEKDLYRSKNRQCRPEINNYVVVIINIFTVVIVDNVTISTGTDVIIAIVK